MDAEVQTWSHLIYENKAFLNLNHLLHCEARISYTSGTLQCLVAYVMYMQLEGVLEILEYSGPSLKGRSLERTPLYKGHKFLAASTMNVRDAPSHQRTPL